MIHRLLAAALILGSSVPTAGAAGPKSADKGWTPLFNGKDLTGWKAHPDKPGKWRVEDGAIVSGGDAASYLFSERGDYENFHLRVEVQINAEGDSGVFFRSEFGLSRRGKAGVSPAGYEAQILVGGKEKTQRTGSLNSFVAVNDRLVEPDAWFILEVIAEGKHIVLKVNGKTTADFMDEKGTYSRGHFALQQYTPATIVKIRKIEVKDFSAAPTAKAAPAKLPETFDLCKYQTPIRNQGARDTCPYFPPIAALEAAYARAGVKVDLSVEHLIWLRNVATGSDKNDRATAENMSCMVGGGNGIWILKRFAVCRAQDMPYHGNDIQNSPFGKLMGVEHYDWGKPFNQFVLDRFNFDPHVYPPQARIHAQYGIEAFKTFAPQDVQNPRKYEEVLASGHEIVFSINIHENGPPPPAGELPVWHLNANAQGDSVNHFMLIVGYDRPHKLFIVKNQWGPAHYAPYAKRLAPGWKEFLKYEGFNFVGYDYLATCSEAHYITEVAPVDSPRYTSQRALGQWKVTFQHKDAKLLTGVLCWRKLPTAAAGPNKADLRIGNLYTADRQQYRVNAELEGDGTKPFGIKFYIDFAKGALPTDSTGGTAWRGALTLSDKGNGALTLKSAGGARQKIKDVAVEDLEINADLMSETNLLKAMPAPK